MSAGRPPPRIYVDAPLGPGGAVALTAAQANYLGAVMRRGACDRLLLFNGRDGEWRAKIAALGRKRAAATVESQTRPQADGPDLWLLFAPVKRTPIDRIARAATELGVSGILPVVTRRTAARRVNLDRLRANAIEAAEQCQRLTVPDCRAPVRLDEALADWPPDRRLLLCDETGAGNRIAEALDGALDCAPAGPWAVAVGPEGGFAADEIAALAALPGALRVGLGPRILRAETAAAAALACWQAIAGDWT